MSSVLFGMEDGAPFLPFLNLLADSLGYSGGRHSWPYLLEVGSDEMEFHLPRGSPRTLDLLIKRLLAPILHSWHIPVAVLYIGPSGGDAFRKATRPTRGFVRAVASLTQLSTN